MPRIVRTARVEWEGNLARGRGAISAGTGAFATLPYSNPSRIASAADETSPEELLAAAHAGCFAMSLAGELAAAGAAPARLDVRCEIVMDEVPGEGHQIVGSNVDVRVALDDLKLLTDAVEAADAGCPFSSLLKKAGVEVQIEVRGASRA
jgi:osmotically inducible protein OsmC